MFYFSVIGMDSNNAVSIEIEEDTVSFREHQDKVRENLGICITIFGIILVAVVVTTIKIILFDKETYPSIFYTPEEILAMKNSTVSVNICFFLVLIKLFPENQHNCSSHCQCV